MGWFVTTGVGAKPIGPFPEEQVVEMIRGGMSVAAVHEQGGSGDWVAPSSHAAFALALPPTMAAAPKETKRVTYRPSPLQMMAYLSAILGFGVYAGETTMEHIRAFAGSATGGLEMSAYTGIETASITLTNRKKLTQWACFKGEVTHSTSRDKVSSAVVCSGEMKPMTTVSLQAPYPIGKIREMCTSKNQFGTAMLDWSQCDFNVVDLSDFTK